VPMPDMKSPTAVSQGPVAYNRELRGQRGASFGGPHRGLGPMRDAQHSEQVLVAPLG
jgi:hypothetical protein